MNSQNFWDPADDSINTEKFQAETKGLQEKLTKYQDSPERSANFRKILVALLIVSVLSAPALMQYQSLEVAIAISGGLFTLFLIVTIIHYVSIKRLAPKAILLDLATRNGWLMTTSTSQTMAKFIYKTAKDLYPWINPTLTSVTNRVWGKIPESKEKSFFMGTVSYAVSNRNRSSSSNNQNQQKEKGLITIIKLDKMIEPKLTIKSQPLSLKNIFKHIKKFSGKDLNQRDYKFEDLYEVYQGEEKMDYSAAEKVIGKDLIKQMESWARELKNIQIILDQNLGIITRNDKWEIFKDVKTNFFQSGQIQPTDTKHMEELLNENFKIIEDVKKNYLDFTKRSTTASI